MTDNYDKEKAVLNELKNGAMSKEFFLTEFLSMLSDDNYWEPFLNDPAKLFEFDKLVQIVEDSQSWDWKKNKQKGSALENLAEFIFKCFSKGILSKVEKNKLRAGNEKDIITTFKEILPMGIQNFKGKIICECKNLSNDTVDVGMVAKLSEICEGNNAGLGVFISINGLSGSGWEYAEGKCRKLYLSTKIPIISFKLDEIKKLREINQNFYSLVLQKFSCLIDEIDFYSGNPISHQTNFPYSLFDNIAELEKMNILTIEEKSNAIKRINEKYGMEVSEIYN